MTQTEYDLYEQWREDYALMYEPNYDEHLEADCKAAFFGWYESSSQCSGGANDIGASTAVHAFSDES